MVLGREEDLWQEWDEVDQDMATPVGQLLGGGAGEEAGTKSLLCFHMPCSASP